MSVKDPSSYPGPYRRITTKPFKILATTYGDIELAEKLLQVSGASKTAQAAQRRLDRAHARYLSAIKALATTQKLLRSTLSPLELAVKFVPEEKPGAAGLRPAVAPTEGVPVLN